MTEIAIGVGTAAIVGLFAIRGLVRWLGRAGFGPFCVYRLGFAAFILYRLVRA
jgi:undecaprenyl pyrophosphate phosphatase UppP